MGRDRRVLGTTQRLVVKVGTSSITHAGGQLNLHQMRRLAGQLAELRKRGKEVLLVSSGAIGAGLGRLGLTRRPRTIPEYQALAAVGQGILMHVYEQIFSEYGIVVGQVLLTREDFADRRRFLNARHTLTSLLQFGAIPIINENDTVAVDEIKFGDNDNLAALVAGLVDAELLILLSDIDGLYTDDPRRCPEARLIREVEEITPEIEALAKGTGAALGTGGMVTKLQAAHVAGHCGVTVVIARAGEEDVILRIVAGEEVGTVFWPVTRLENRKRWIAYSTPVQGRIVVDEGAVRALQGGKSLLPSGVVAVEGTFEMGNTVSIVDPRGKEIARGIVNFSSGEVEKIKGCRTSEIAGILGHKDYDEVVHRNNLVLGP